MVRILNEKWLVYQVRAKKDPEAFASLYDLYVEKIYRFVYFKINNKEDAEDIVSSVFLKVWSYLIEYTEKEIDSFSGLIYKIARNLVIDHYREKGKIKKEDLEDFEELPAEENNYETVATNMEVEQLMVVIKKMKQDYQEVLLLKHVEELSTAEIAEILGKSQVGVRITLHRAIKKLQEMVNKK
ncbi:MAG: RNA polymerase, sigma-24 subunit, ECF subfamily [Candidatus Magasanikbacteria bacterium GW2011_GWC2_37_14]|uniref:RNA polymerase, sigma-24 subunit, ECF subfamily n=1 Tax=Candidatus Magasanikbacteria bacterium GW2011_GWC2_37_14 TaxID=1619046 RepID=A0A0G0JII3_9BACT|nr:MAG: RNA polymerase, sigma-24 subunit, ECF subfamily [Candidatus Magasanikbacteria bacterium GW2011_GWC2_37_14]